MRDNRAGGGGVNTDDTVVTVHNTGARFAVTAPNDGGPTLSGDTTVTWNVAGTTAAPVSAANVSIRLSTDGGLTYPIELDANVPNDGSQPVELPSITNAAARIMVHSGSYTGSGFFDITDANFSIEPGTVPNEPPTVDAGGPYSALEGGSVTLTASGSDPNGDSLTYAWDLDNNGSFETPGQSVSFDASGLDGPSSYTVNVRATDPLGLSAQASATVNVANVAPTVTAEFAADSVTCGTSNATLRVAFSDPAAADTHSAVIDWGDGNAQTVSAATSPLVLSHTYAAAGSYTATIRVSDDDGGTGNANADVMVQFDTSGFLPPINPDGTSVFKYRTTIPVKISFTDCDGSVPNDLAPTIKVTMISGATPILKINERASASAADTSGVMRFSTNQYIYNLATKPLPDRSATYRFTVTIPSNGQTFALQFGLKP